MKMSKIKKSVILIVLSEIAILFANIVSFKFYINIQVAFLSSFFVIVGASYGYKRMIESRVSSDDFEEKRDLLDEIEDPYELYSDEDISKSPYEEPDLKQIIKEEKEKIKTFSMTTAKHGAKGSLSAFRLVSYVFLFLGFIALKNNNLMDVSVYFPSIFGGIVVGTIFSKGVFVKV